MDDKEQAAIDALRAAGLEAEARMFAHRDARADILELDGERGVLLGLLTDCAAVLRTIDPDKPPTEMMFEARKALARLLAEEVIFLNSHWWEEDWPERAQKITSLNVNCNDIFAWGCADAEELEYSEIQGLYDLWRADRTWGAAKWCAVKRRQQPQPPVIEHMKKAGAWDACMEALGANTQDTEVQAMFAALRAPNEKDHLMTDSVAGGQSGAS